jgi:myo-inositol 2-dehydrogenase / D-chiro-inositol 1-dehydrogenase
MDDLLVALSAGQTYNEADWAAESTMTALLGRMASYSGKIVTWEDAINSQLDLALKSMVWDAETPVTPGRPDGSYACAVPGVIKAW